MATTPKQTREPKRSPTAEDCEDCYYWALDKRKEEEARQVRWHKIKDAVAIWAVVGILSTLTAVLWWAAQTYVKAGGQ